MRALLSAALIVVLVGGCAAAQQRNDAFTWTPSPIPAATPIATPSPSLVPTFTPDPTLTALPTSDPGYTPDPTQPHSSPTPVAGPYDVDLYRKGAFVSEVEKYMCLAAAMQVMINIMKDGPVDTTADTQWRLYEEARTYLIPPYVNGDTGAQPEGWAASLNAEGYGPYQMAIRPTMEDAIHLAARQMRLTGKPVGLLVWRGAHSWAMSGFRSNIDPLISDNFTVDGIYAEDVWYPRISSIWGPSFPPDTFDPYDQLPIDYLHYKRPREVHPDKDGQWVLIVPTLPGQTV
jgi:hypothetical protein